MAEEGVGGRRLPVEGALALSWGEWREVGGRVVGGRDGARRRGIRMAGREALKGGPQSVLAPRAGSSVRPEGLGSCCALKGLQGRSQRRIGLSGRRGGRWRGEREKWRGEAGAGARPRASYWGALLRTRLYWGMGAKGRGGEGAKVLEAEMGLCRWRARKDGGPEGEERKLAGEGWGRWRGRLGNQQEGAVLGWERAGGGRQGDGQRVLQGEAAAGPWACSPTPKEEGTISQVPASPPAEGAICPGFFGLGMSS